MLNRALSISRDIETPRLTAEIMENLGIVHQVMGSMDAARSALLEAVRIFRRLGARANEAVALTSLGNFLKEYDEDLTGAWQAYRQSVDIVESIRGGLKKELHRITYAQAGLEPYALAIGCLLDLKRPDQALEYVERAKSRALLDFLAKRDVPQAATGSDSKPFREAKRVLAEIGEMRKNLEAITRQEENEPAAEN